MNVVTVRARLQEIIQDLSALDAEREALLAVKRGYEALLNLHRDDPAAPAENRGHAQTDPIQPGSHVHLAGADPVVSGEDREVAPTDPVARGTPRHLAGATSVEQNEGRIIARTDHAGTGQRRSEGRVESGLPPLPKREPTAAESVVSAPSPISEGPITFRRAIAQVMRGAGDAPIASQVILDRARELGGRTEAKRPLSAIDQTLKSLADRDDLPVLQVGFRLWRWTGQVEPERRLRNER